MTFVRSAMTKQVSVNFLIKCRQPQPQYTVQKVSSLFEVFLLK